MKNVAHDTSKDPRLIDIGNRIKRLRIDKGYSSAEIFAYEHELNRVSYWRIERGSNLTLSTLLRILDIHNLSLQEFFGEGEKTSAKK
ncbi:MAG TPA: helix-turn-helix transcriptional regulator [Paludibacteraceae bacterium]|nr:helix-turn-helix transcriptional regulator [Paludibacteraceae bacterium]